MQQLNRYPPLVLISSLTSYRHKKPIRIQCHVSNVKPQVIKNCTNFLIENQFDID